MTTVELFAHIFNNGRCPLCNQLIIISQQYTGGSPRIGELETHITCDACQLSAIHCDTLTTISLQYVWFNLTDNKTIIWNHYVHGQTIHVNSVPSPFNKETVANFVNLAITLQ